MNIVYYPCCVQSTKLYLKPFSNPPMTLLFVEVIKRVCTTPAHSRVPRRYACYVDASESGIVTGSFFKVLLDSECLGGERVKEGLGDVEG